MLSMNDARDPWMERSVHLANGSLSKSSLEMREGPGCKRKYSVFLGSNNAKLKWYQGTRMNGG